MHCCFYLFIFFFQEPILKFWLQIVVKARAINFDALHQLLYLSTHVATYHTQAITYNKLLCQDADHQKNGCLYGTPSASHQEIRHRLQILSN